jgi:molybdenum cofactor synthesis domain-containing protein
MSDGGRKAAKMLALGGGKKNEKKEKKPAGKMHPLKTIISLAEARKILDANSKPVERVEEVALLELCGRVLAQDIKAPIDVPPFNRAAMDGYAVIASDTFGAGQLKPKKLKLIGTVHAGGSAGVAVKKGTCIQIATGAPMPKGADSVIMVEETESQGANIKIYRAVHPGENVGKKGEDINAGAIVLKSGELLNPAKVGVLAALGFEKVSVFAKPKIAVIPSGNEIIEQGEALSAGKIYDVNSFTLSALVAQNGCLPSKEKAAPDSLGAVREVLQKAAQENDLVIISGGSSVGEKDVMVGAIESEGKLLFHGIAVKPGKPTLCGIIGGKMVIGMPGYPTSCLTNGYALLAPLLRKMARLPVQEQQKIRAKMARRTTSTIGRFQFLPVKIEKGKAVPVFKESGAITSMSLADGYIEIPENVDLLEKDEGVEVILF